MSKGEAENSASQTIERSSLPDVKSGEKSRELGD